MFKCIVLCVFICTAYSPPARGDPARIPLKTITYDLVARAWLFRIIPIRGRARFEVAFHKDGYRIVSKVETSGLADIFINYRMDLEAGDFKPAAIGHRTTTVKAAAWK